MLVYHWWVSDFKLLLGPSLSVVGGRVKRNFFFFPVDYLAVVRVEGCATVAVLPNS